MSALPPKADIRTAVEKGLLMTQSGHSALLTNVVADDAAGEAGFRLPHHPRRRIDTAGAPVPLPGRFFFLSATAGKIIPCDAHHCAPGCVGLESDPTESAARYPGTCFVSDEAPPPGVVRNAYFWYGFTNQRGHPGNGMEFPRTG